MKKKTMKTMLAAVCVLAAGFGGMKAYNAANQSEGNSLFVENVEALSAGECNYWCHSTQCGTCANGYGGNSWDNASNWRYPW